MKYFVLIYTKIYDQRRYSSQVVSQLCGTPCKFDFHEKDLNQIFFFQHNVKYLPYKKFD